MRLVTKPAIIVWAIVPLTVSLLLVSDDLLDALLSWLWEHGLVAVGVSAASVLLTVPLLLALLRWNWQIRLVDAVGICSAWNIACGAAFSSIWLAAPWLSNGSVTVTIGTLVFMSTFAFASVLYMALYVWAPHTRTRRFALQWIVGLTLTSVLVALPIGAAAVWFFEDMELVLPVLFVLPGGSWFVNVLVSTDASAVVESSDLRWLAWGASTVAVLGGVIGSAWFMWT